MFVRVRKVGLDVANVLDVRSDATYRVYEKVPRKTNKTAIPKILKTVKARAFLR